MLGKKKIATTLALLLIAFGVLSARLATSGTRRINRLPRLVLWAWERPEDLRFINPDDTAVAFLASTVQLHATDVVVRPRLQPLRVPNQTRLVAVTRIEAATDAALNDKQIEQSVAAIANSAKLSRVVAIQVDFDATLSQRAFYRQLLTELRQREGPDMPISITALASWCLDDGWISNLPIDEAVPMLFRMGAGTRDVVTSIASGGDFRPAVCRGSLGVSSDERWASLPGGRRLYLFSPKSWTPQSEQAMLWEARSWR